MFLFRLTIVFFLRYAFSLSGPDPSLLRVYLSSSHSPLYTVYPWVYFLPGDQLLGLLDGCWRVMSYALTTRSLRPPPGAAAVLSFLLHRHKTAFVVVVFAATPLYGSFALMSSPSTEGGAREQEEEERSLCCFTTRCCCKSSSSSGFL